MMLSVWCGVIIIYFIIIYESDESGLVYKRRQSGTKKSWPTPTFLTFLVDKTSFYRHSSSQSAHTKKELVILAVVSSRFAKPWKCKQRFRQANSYQSDYHKSNWYILYTMNRKQVTDKKNFRLRLKKLKSDIEKPKLKPAVEDSTQLHEQAGGSLPSSPVTAIVVSVLLRSSITKVSLSRGDFIEESISMYNCMQLSCIKSYIYIMHWCIESPLYLAIEASFSRLQYNWGHALFSWRLACTCCWRKRWKQQVQ